MIHNIRKQDEKLNSEFYASQQIRGEVFNTKGVTPFPETSPPLTGINRILGYYTSARYRMGAPIKKF